MYIMHFDRIVLPPPCPASHLVSLQIHGFCVYVREPVFCQVYIETQGPRVIYRNMGTLLVSLAVPTTINGLYVLREGRGLLSSSPPVSYCVYFSTFLSPLEKENN